jgi:ABC-type multidrug transport system fused ATPase/permease subunit
MYYLGTLHVLAGTLTLGSLLVFSAYLLMLYQPLEALTYTAWAMEGATAGAKRCFEVLDREDDVRDSPDAVEISDTRAAIGFDQVNFSYDAQNVLWNRSPDFAQPNRRPGRRNRCRQEHTAQSGPTLLRSDRGCRHARRT